MENISKLEAAQIEYEEWSEAIGIKNLDDLREAIRSGRATEIINICEARQERKYAEIADQIYWNRDKAKIVMMAGPSSSGKTSSSLRIAQQCKVLGLNPKVIELDNYFVDREFTPKDENGEYDFECLAAMDTELLNKHLNALLSGEEVEIPTFNFVEGRKEYNGKMLKLEKNDILMMEGIHALNPELTYAVDQSKIFKVYISALSALKASDTDQGSTTDKRLLRRIIRDSRTRGHSPEATILRWPSVRRGEKKWIFPFAVNADMAFNSSMLYDLPLLKYYAEPLLYEIKETSPAFEKAQELLSLLEKVDVLQPKEIGIIPPTSIMREFVGGQTL